MKHDDFPYLNHILDAISDIGNSTLKMSKSEFEENKDVRDATIRRIEIIGEAVKNLSKEFRKNHPEIEWARIAGTRDRMIHAYFSVDLDVVWEIVKRDLPKLKRQIKAILKKI